MLTPVTTYYLEMTDRAQLRPKGSSRTDLEFQRVEPPDPSINCIFYQEVGRAWQWRDRLPWTAEQWKGYVERLELQTWIARVGGTAAGYAELELQADRNVEIVYFGLLPAFLGQGLGGHFLTETVERAWGLAADRVWVHTCSLDHPAALANYLARGFRQFREETSNQQFSRDLDIKGSDILS